MFESATILTIRFGRLDESITILREIVFPILLAQPGLLSLGLIPQPEQSRLALLTIWKSRAHAQAAEANPRYRQAVKQLDPLILQPESETTIRPWQPRLKTLVYSPN